MSVSKKWTSDPENQRRVLAAYRKLDPLLTTKQVSDSLGATVQNVCRVLQKHMPEAERRALVTLRYSHSKTGKKNPMTGKTGKKHHSWKGQCDDGYGYLTCMHKGKRVFVHRLVFAQSMGLEPAQLPRKMIVHHIDNDPKNNHIDNLALETNVGHVAIHYLQVKDSLSVALKKSTIAEVFKSMTLP